MKKKIRNIGRGVKCPICGKTRMYIRLDPYDPMWCQHRELDFINKVIELQDILDKQPSECEHLDECTEYAIENHEPDRDPNG